MPNPQLNPGQTLAIAFSAGAFAPGQLWRVRDPLGAVIATNTAPAGWLVSQPSPLATFTLTASAAAVGGVGYQAERTWSADESTNYAPFDITAPAPPPAPSAPLRIREPRGEWSGSRTLPFRRPPRRRA